MKRKGMAHTLAVTLTAVCFSSPSGAQTWSSLPDMPVPLTRLATAHSNGQVFVLAGETRDTDCIARVDAYNLRTGAWERKADAPEPLCAHAAVANRGKIYVFGGFSDGIAVDRVLVYDPKKDRWTPAARMPSKRAHHAAASSSNGRIYVFGGQDHRGSLLAAADEFDPQAGTWRSIAPLPEARTSLAAAVGCEGLIYAIGGAAASTADGSLYAYDVSAGTWARLADMPKPAVGHAAARGTDGRIYVLGGEGTGFATADVQVYDPTSGSWSEGPAMSSARTNLAAVALGNRVFALGGRNKDLAQTAFHEALGPLRVGEACKRRSSGFPGTDVPVEDAVLPGRPTQPVGDFGRPGFDLDPKCTWTDWLNRDGPSGSGDFETVSEFFEPRHTCRSPVKMECRATDGRRWSDTGQKYTCDKATGGVCRNVDQPGGRCLDYEVRFCCPIAP